VDLKLSGIACLKNLQICLKSNPAKSSRGNPLELHLLWGIIVQDSRGIKLSDLEFNGEHLFVYSDRFNIFFFFFDHEENKLYKITTDKFFMIDSIIEIYTPENFEGFKKIKFFKPFFANHSDHVFTGIIQFDTLAFKFKITDKDTLTYTEEIVYSQPDGIINSLMSIKTIDINYYIQKKNQIYLVGYDKEYGDYIFAIVNIEDDKLDKVYSLSSDYGDIIPFAINLDVDEKRIYVVGRMEYINKDNEVEKVKPFFETFLLN